MLRYTHNGGKTKGPWPILHEKHLTKVVWYVFLLNLLPLRRKEKCDIYARSRWYGVDKHVGLIYTIYVLGLFVVINKKKEKKKKKKLS